MALDIAASVPSHVMGTRHRLPATPETVYWGYIDRDEPARLTVRSGDTIEIEAITHHAGDAPDLLCESLSPRIAPHAILGTREPSRGSESVDPQVPVGLV